MTRTFLSTLSFTLKWEGGYVNDPSDLGGATNYGVTQKTYDAFRSANGFSKQPVRSISLTEMRDIYWRQYWLPAQCEHMPPRVAVIVFDTAVQRGVSKAVSTLQEAIGAKTDGSFGINSNKALIEYVSANGEAELVNRYVDKRVNHHRLRALIPTQRKFLQGWLNRCKSLREFALNLKEEI